MPKTCQEDLLWKTQRKDSRATWSGFRQNLKKQNGNHLLAYETLLQHGFLHRPTLYLACGCKSLGPPVETDKSKVVTVYVQCGMRKCSTKNQSSILPAFMIRRRRKTKQQRREVIPKPCNMSNVNIYIYVLYYVLKCRMITRKEYEYMLVNKYIYIHIYTIYTVIVDMGVGHGCCSW